MSVNKVSIIVPSLNQGKFIKETIESILSQDYNNIECIVMDGGSTDDTLDILKSFGEKISYTSEKDNGQSDAINKGIQRSSGDIVAFLNSDDVYLPGTISQVVGAFSHRNTSWVTGDYMIIDEKGKEINSHIASYKRFLRKFPSLNTLLIANYIVQPSTFWQKDLHKEVGFFNQTLHYCMDFDFWVRLFKREYHPIILQKTLSKFRVHSQSKGKRQFIKQFREEHDIVKTATSNLFRRTLHLFHILIIIVMYLIMSL
jgi:glycosyltransferase involved in cell wall biosynthesis